jgi:hypothetical protein
MSNLSPTWNNAPLLKLSFFRNYLHS